MFTSPLLPFIFFDQPAPGFAAFLQEVRSHEGHPQRVVLHVDRAVGEDHRNLRGLGLAQHRLPTGLDHGREGDHVDLLRDEGADGADLIFLLLLRVGEFEVDAGILGRGLDRFRVGGAPFAFGADLREAQHDLFLGENGQGHSGHQGRRAKSGNDNAALHFHGFSSSLMMDFWFVTLRKNSIASACACAPACSSSNRASKAREPVTG
jgi:hypothetical protein